MTQNLSKKELIEKRRDELREYIQRIGTLRRDILPSDELAQKYNVSKRTILKDISEIEKTLDIEEKVGIITKNQITDGEDVYEKICFGYINKINEEEFHRIGHLLFFPNRQIATIEVTYQDEVTGDLQKSTTSQGMNRKELEHFFPARPVEQKQYGSTYHLRDILRSIIYEAYIKEGLPGTIDGGSLRHFWYTHFKPLLVKTLGLTENNSLNTAMNDAWDAMIGAGLVTYEGMDITSSKESGRASFVKDSPFNNIIIAVEKQNFFETFKWIPELFNCTLITSGGQSSRAVARAFIYELSNLGVNLDQDFHMCIASDCDPAGYSIEQTFCNQIESAITYYGGTGKVTINRLFVRPDQVSESLLQSQGIPWRPKITDKKDKKNQEKEKRKNDTIWERFCERTNGGIYIPKPDGWDASDVLTEDTVMIDGKPMVRALLEMDAFNTKTIEKSLLTELLRIIRETSDETKIMIPEIMRVFESVRTDVIQDVYEKWKRELIDPLKQQFLSDTKEWNDFINDTRRKDKQNVEEDYKEKIDEKENEKREREPELFDEQETCDEIIESLREERDEKIREIREDYDDQLRGTQFELEDVNELIDEKCEDLDEDIKELKDERTDELDQIDDEFELRFQQYKQFREDHLAVFNPVEQALKSDIEKRLSDDYLPYQFRDLESDENTKNYISTLCVNTKLLIDENISCFYHPAPAFIGENYLEKAAQNKDMNIGSVRDSFSDSFLKAMKQIIHTDANKISFELSKTIEMKDLSQEVKTAMEKTEEDIEKNRDEMDGDDE